MSKLKPIFLLSLIAGVLAFGYFQFQQTFEKDQGDLSGQVTRGKFIEADSISWYHPDNRDFNLALFNNPLSINYTPENAQSIEEQSFLNDYSLATNGSYFRGSSVEAEHAGLLQLDGEVIFNKVPDPQLTHVVIYDKFLDKLSFADSNKLDLGEYAGENYSLFQTGPLIIENNKIQENLISNSLNGKSRALRTVMGIVNDKERFLMVTRRNYTLQELAEQILEFEIFKGKDLSVINLDGGASTAMYSEDLEQFNFMKSRRLPLVIGIK